MDGWNLTFEKPFFLFLIVPKVSASFYRLTCLLVFSLVLSLSLFHHATAHQDAQKVASSRWHEMDFMNLWMHPGLYIMVMSPLYILDKTRAIMCLQGILIAAFIQLSLSPHSLLDKDWWSLSLCCLPPICLFLQTIHWASLCIYVWMAYFYLSLLACKNVYLSLCLSIYIQQCNPFLFSVISVFCLSTAQTFQTSKAEDLLFQNSTTALLKPL